MHIYLSGLIPHITSSTLGWTSVCSDCCEAYDKAFIYMCRHSYRSAFFLLASIQVLKMWRTTMGLLIINDISLVKYILLALPAEITQHILLVWPQEINKEDQCNLCTYSMMKLLGAHTHLDLQASGLHWNLYIKKHFYSYATIQAMLGQGLSTVYFFRL